MFPSWTPQTMLGKSFTEDENPNSSQEEHSPSLFSHFPPPFLEDNDEFLINHLFSQQQFTANLAQTEVSSVADSNKATAPTTPNPKPLAKKRSVNGGAKKSVPRKRTGKKDRHSKIYTAQGLRDRRMRLSVQIARKFFDLQDLLGFDKASKTIDWLLSKSNAAIKELTADLPETNQICSASEKSSVSCAWETEEKVADNGDHKGFEEKHELKKSEKWRTTAAWGPLQVRKSREKARARARERTRKKVMIRNLQKLTALSEENPRNLQPLQPSSALQIGEESSSRSQETNSSMGSERIAENVAMKTMNPSAGNVQEKYPCSIFMTSSNAPQEQRNPNLISMSISNSQKYCPNSIFVAAPNSPEKNPISIFISPTDIQEQNPTFLTTSNVHLWSQYF